MLVDTLETELRILELQKRLAAQLQVRSAARLCACLLACLPAGTQLRQDIWMPLSLPRTNAALGGATSECPGQGPSQMTVAATLRKLHAKRNTRVAS